MSNPAFIGWSSFTPTGLARKPDATISYPKRNLDIEDRIRKNTERNHKYKINVYGGMGMDGDIPSVLKDKYEELDYIKNHPEIYPKNSK